MITLRNIIVFTITALVVIFINTMVTGFFDMQFQIKPWTTYFWCFVFPLQICITMFVMELPKTFKLYSDK